MINKKKQSLSFIILSVLIICLFVGGFIFFLGASFISDNQGANTDVKNIALSDTLMTAENFGDDPISITGNVEFSLYPGSGTSEDPYLISNLRIDAEYNTSGILIKNTDVHFRIENVTVIQGKPGDGGFQLENVTNGNLLDNNAINNTIGFKLIDSDYNNLTDNYAEQNAVGFFLINSTDNTLTNNIAYNNNEFIADNEGLGFYLETNSDNNTLTSNTADNNGEVGIAIEESESNEIADNTIEDNGYGVIIDSSNDNILTNNTISNNGEEGIGLLNSNQTYVNENTVNNNEKDGILVGESHNNQFIGNTMNENGNYGLHLTLSNDNTITENMFNNNNDGCWEEEWSTGNDFTDNTCEEDNGDTNGNGDTDGSDVSIPGFNIMIILGITTIILSSLLMITKKNVN